MQHPSRATRSFAAAETTGRWGPAVWEACRTDCRRPTEGSTKPERRGGGGILPSGQGERDRGRSETERARFVLLFRLYQSSWYRGNGPSSRPGNLLRPGPWPWLPGV
jgi:hypothetical protein